MEIKMTKKTDQELDELLESNKWIEVPMPEESRVLRKVEGENAGIMVSNQEILQLDDWVLNVESIGSEDHKPWGVCINMNGELITTGDYTPDKAAKELWACIAAEFMQLKQAIVDDYKKSLTTDKED